MEALLAFLGAGFVIATFWSFAATSNGIKLTRENELLRRQLREHQQAGALALDMLKALEKIKPVPAKFDQQTTSLIKLAVSNTNDHEARTAAVQVCKRLYKQLK